jgi:hypothetical protein
MATTTNYGFEIPDDTDLVKDGALAMRDLGQDVDTQLFTALGGDYPGLRLVKKQTIGTGVSSVTVTDAFSATYDAYKIIITGGASSANNYGYLQLGASTTGYNFGSSAAPYAGGTVQGLAASNAASFLYTWYMLTDFLALDIDLANPFLTKKTSLKTNFHSEGFGFAGGGYHNVAASYTAFTIGSIGAQTLTGGTIYVYGYGAS